MAAHAHSDHADALSSVDAYVDAIRGARAGDVKVAVIGSVIGEGDAVVAARCVADDDGVSDACWSSRGRSNTDSICGPLPTNAEAIAGRGCDGDGRALPWCVADAGERLLAFSNAFGGFADSICQESFHQTMIDIAVSFADVDVVTLVEAADDPALVLVVKRSDAGDETLTRIDGEQCGDEDGWLLEPDARTVRLCGAARPRPGETISVRARGPGADVDSDDPNACSQR